MGLEALAVSFSKGVQMTLFIGTGDGLEAEIKTAVGAGTETGKGIGTGAFVDVRPDAPTAIAFSMRLCALEGSMTSWLSS